LYGLRLIYDRVEGSRRGTAAAAAADTHRASARDCREDPDAV
jgi:hypothetical protein